MNIRILLGLVPETAKYENDRDLLFEEFERFKNYEKSDELTEYHKLKEEVNSYAFKSKVKEIKSQKFSQTPEYRVEQEYLALKKSADIKSYYSFSKSGEAEWVASYEKSPELKEIRKVEKYIVSAEFLEAQKDKKAFKNSQEFHVVKQLKDLKSAPGFSKYNKLLKSKTYRNYVNLSGSERLANCEKLEKQVNSDPFKKVKDYMLLPPSEKYKLSDEHAKEQAFYAIEKSDIYKWYIKAKKGDRFKAIKVLDKTFEDHFDDKKLQQGKWLTRYFWGEALLKQSYSLSTDKHYVTDGKNLDINNSVLTIVTKKEDAQGKAWDKKYGFFDKKYSITSGLINTGNSFRQKYGLFEAKIKINPTYPVNHAFWLVGDKMLPHIDIVKYDKKICLDAFWLNGSDKVHKKTSKLSPSKYTTGYFIYSLEWKPGKIIWKINGVPVTSLTSGLPDEPLYLNFSSGITNESLLSALPATVEIDWVRCYQYNHII